MKEFKKIYTISQKEANFLILKQWLLRHGIAFDEISRDMNDGALKYIINGKKYKADFSKKICKKYLGLANSIKSKIKKVVDLEDVNRTLPLMHINNIMIYKNKKFIASQNEVELERIFGACYEYDLNNAYFSVLLYLYPHLYEQIQILYELKKKNKEVYQRVLGMILLGSKRVTQVNEHGKVVDSQLITNPLTPVFYLIRYLIIASLRKMLAGAYRENRIANFVDAVQVNTRLSVHFLSQNFEWYFYDTFQQLNERFQKYIHKDIFVLFGIEKNIFEKMFKNEIFTFKEKPISFVSVSFSNGFRRLEFLRDNQNICYKA